MRIIMFIFQRNTFGGEKKEKKEKNEKEVLREQ